MNKKIYGIMFGLGVFCMLGLLTPSAARLQPDEPKEKLVDDVTDEKGWHTSNVDSWGVNAGYGSISVGVERSWKDSHGAMVAAAIGVGEADDNGCIDYWDSSDVDQSEDEQNLYWPDHDWNADVDLHSHHSELVDTGYQEEVQHTWLFDYTVTHHEDHAWPNDDQDDTTTHSGYLEITVGVSVE